MLTVLYCWPTTAEQAREAGLPSSTLRSAGCTDQMGGWANTGGGKLQYS